MSVPFPAAGDGPCFEDLSVGEVFDTAPPLTLTEAHAAVHQSIVGDRLRMPLDVPLSRSVARSRTVHPALVWDVAIGQSTLVTRRVIANLFYRGLVLRRLPSIDDTLSTSTEVVGLKQNRGRPERAASGLAALRVTTRNQHGRPVLDFWRCAMLPLRDPRARTGAADDMAALGVDPSPTDFARAVRDWDRLPLEGLRGTGPVPAPGTGPCPVPGGDVVSSAPELARLTLNVASAHHDATATGDRRLVYGGHTIGVALSQAARAFPEIVTVTGWHGCDHLGPVHEGDTLHSTVETERVETVEGVRLAHLRSRVGAREHAEAPTREVLDWRFVALLA